jgi:formate/nitrite transporter FocA (FNT family)
VSDQEQEEREEEIAPEEHAWETPEPEEMYIRAKREGENRLQRPISEICSTALAAGFDIVAGVTVMAIIAHLVSGHFGREVGHLIGSIGFGIGFVYLIAGRAELFTENFLVPIAGLDHRDGSSWRNLARLWILSPIFNLLGGAIVIVILTTHGVLPSGTGVAVTEISSTLHRNHVLSLFMGAVFAGALITAMTWYIEGNVKMHVRVTVAWTAGFILALGGFNHVIVVTLELFYGIRFGDDIPWIFLLGNFGIATLGNMIGGIGLVTLNRFTQATARLRAQG